MKTVLHIIERLADFGGTPRKMLYLAAHNDYSASRLVFVPYLAAPPEATLEAKVRDYGATVANLDTISLPRLIRRIAAVARSTRADVICTHFTRPLIAGFLVSRWLGLPLVHNEHSSAAHRKGAGRRAAQFCLPFANAVICNSKDTLNSIARDYRVAHDKLRVLYNPVEERNVILKRCRVREQLNLKDDDVLIGNVGGLLGWRDHATLMRAFSRIRSIRNDVRLIIIGDGPLRAELELLATTLGIRGAVDLLGYTERIGDYLNAMDIYVNPALDEGFGIAVVEAMLAGLPVVLADAGAHPELITDGTHGHLFPRRDDSRLTDILLELIGQPDSRRRLGEMARETARPRFAPARYAIGYDAIVNDVLGRNGTLNMRVSDGTD